MASPAYAPILPQVARRVSSLIADELTIINSVLELAEPDMYREDVVEMSRALHRIEQHRKALQDATT